MPSRNIDFNETILIGGVVPAYQASLSLVMSVSKEARHALKCYFPILKALFKDFFVIMYCLILNPNDLKCQQ